ncbi:hypothetical protein D8674_022250 [Pyrus ussuriensis x Pyrus communis]|uniref:Aminotransferase-like plant mobile domain-containing protein n=1 Tax=Pyrus ussuriensis x Pyrus communis TaxID=2448454 RepID=A0A5N5GPU8_9ROSA|nr:hypothetical protein D8674_022250 [Pyrus ussuriensis x Pyrus communis]
MKDEAWSQWVDELEPIWKQKWMVNGIYKLIMMSKVTIIAKPKLLTIALIFWNNGTNTFDCRMGPKTLTVLDMAQVFGLRPSGKRYPWFSYQIFQDFLGENASSMCKEKFIICRLLTFFSSFADQGNIEEVNVGPEEEAADALVLQKATVEAARQEVGSSQATGDAGYISELFSKSEVKVGPEVEIRAFRQAKVTVVESSESEPEERPQAQPALPGPRVTPTKKMIRAQTSQASKPSSTHPQEDIEVLAKILEELKARGGTSIPQVEQSSSPSSSSLPPPMVITPTSHFNPTTRKMLHYMEDDSTSTTHQPPPAFGEPRYLSVTRIPIPRPRKTYAATFAYESLPSIFTEDVSAAITSGGAGVMPQPFAFIIAMTSFPELVREFGKIKTKLRSPRHPFEPQHLQDLHRQMSNVQYESFISFFENLKALRDQHLWLVEEDSAMKDCIMVVAAEIQQLEQQLSILKKIEEVKKVNLEVEDSEAQLANNNITLEEPVRIFTIM